MAKFAICRLCLADEGTMDQLFSPKTYTINFVQKIYDCTNLRLQDSIDLPSGICEICKNELLSWMKFRRQCINSNRILKSEYPDIVTAVSKENSNKSTQTINEEFLEDVNSKMDNKVEFVSYSEVYHVAEATDDQDIEHSYTETEVISATNFKIDTNRISSDNRSSKKSIEDIQIYSLDNDDPFNNFDENHDVEILLNDDEQHVIEEAEYDDKKSESDLNNLKNISYASDDDEMVDVIPISKMKRKIKKVEKKLNAAGELQVVKTFDGKRITYSHPCPICHQMQTNLKQHMLTHNDELPFKCPYDNCERAFRQKSNLKNHINLHTGEKPYHCKECEKKFSEPSGLRSHMVMHTREKAYHCGVCGKSFSWSHTLTAHQRIHTQDRRHPCSVCSKRFLSAHALKKHTRIHTGEKPYECDICKKTFNTSGNLSSHKRTHKKTERFHCHLCSEKFQRLGSLKKHIKVEHQQDIDENDVEIENNDGFKIEVLFNNATKDK